MLHVVWRLAGIACAINACAFGAPASWTTRVVSVVDGDTLEVEDGSRPGATVRLHLFGIDCPELGQPSGPEARDYVKAACSGKTVTVQLRQTGVSSEVQGDVRLANGSSLVRGLVESGLTWLAPGQDTDPALSELEEKAVASKRGIWRDPKPTPPWEYRKRLASTKSTAVAPPDTKPISVSQSAVEKAWDTGGIGMLIASGAQPYLDQHGAMTGILLPKASAVPLAGQLGLRDGDVVMSVNGVKIRGLDVVAIAEQLEEKPEYHAEVLRGGKTIVLNYVVTK